LEEIIFERELKKVQVFADDREAGGAALEKLSELGAVVKLTRLLVGDFILSERVCVERKTAADFESSIIDGRLFTQAEELKNHFESPLIALIGDEFERIHPKALRGAFIALTVDYKIPMLFFASDEELGEFLYALGEREQLLERKEKKLRFEKRLMPTPEQQLFIVESLPLIGPKNARNLLMQFGSIENIVNSGEKELTKVKGIGKVRAREIKKVLSAHYAEEKEKERQTSEII
jgi:Fanconi anemia group M protein